MAQALPQVQQDQQLALNDGWTTRSGSSRRTQARADGPPLCAGCRQREARYGFRVDDAEPGDDRPRTLCFTCFRVELDYRQAVAARLSRGWNAEQARLPLEQTLRELTRRRRRAQIAARHALDAAGSAAADRARSETAGPTALNRGAAERGLQ
jgi:hypothetical protein